MTMLSINTNVGALQAATASYSVNKSMETSMNRLSTGKRINSAADDAAGLQISQRLTAEIRGIDQAIRNAADGQSMLATAEGATIEIHAILQRMRELALQAANDTNSDLDRRYIQDEIDQLAAEIDRVSDTTQFNSINVLDGSFAGKTFQIGANANQSVTLDIANVAASSLGIGASSTSSNDVASSFDLPMSADRDGRLANDSETFLVDLLSPSFSFLNQFIRLALP